MPNRIRAAWIISASGWLSSVFPTVWAAVITAIGSEILLGLAAGAQAFSNPKVLGFVFLGALFFWTYIGAVWLITRKPSDMKLLRYGLTFEGITPLLDLSNENGALAFSLMFRNYSSVPIIYVIERLDVQIETRTLPSRYIAGMLKGVLSKGAVRIGTPVPFRYDHIKEFMGRQVQGTIDFSVVYGDADRKPIRRLSMSLALTLWFPAAPPQSLIQSKGVFPLTFPLGFSASVISESDQPIDGLR